MGKSTSRGLFGQCSRKAKSYSHSLTLASAQIDIDLGIKELEKFISICGQNQARSLKLYLDLAQLYCFKGDYSRARECYKTMVDAGPSDAGDYVNLGWLFMLEKKFDEALREFEKAAVLAPDDIGTKTNLAAYYTLKDELKKSREILDGLRTVSKDPSSLDGDFIILDLVEGKFREVLNLIEENEKKDKGIESLPLWMNVVLQRRGNIYLQTGHPLKALEEFREALEIVKKEEDRVQDIGFVSLAHNRRTCLIWQICALCDIGNISEAEALYKEFERVVPDYLKKKAIKECFCINLEFLEGKIALSRKNIPEAIRKLEIGWQKLRGEDFLQIPDHAYMLDIMADAYQLDGRLDKAAETYGRIQELQRGRCFWGAVYARSYYKAGKIYEQMGKKAEARFNYQKFLDLWKDVDAGLPEVEDARKRLAAL